MNQFLVNSEPKYRVEAIIAQIIEDDFYQKIINSAAFKRLKYISFLGAIDYAWPCNHLKKTYRTRHNHSLCVAALALHISKKRKYCKDTERHLVSAALLHDIGHAPLSHSMEPAFKSKWGLGHHELTTSIIRGDEKIGKILSSTLRTFLDLQTVLDLIEGKGQPDLAKLFNSPINIDTIDGIIRSYNYTTKKKPRLSPIKVCEAAFLHRQEASESILDEFWRLKDLVYKEFILSGMGVKADLLSQNYFTQKENYFAISDMFGTEKSWLVKHSSLFDSLRKYSKNELFTEFYNSNIEVTRRFYIVNKHIKLNTPDDCQKRYECKKIKDTYTLKKPKEDFFFQPSFYF